LDAKNVSAYGGVGILVKDRYTESQETLFGTVNLAVKVENYTWYHNRFVYAWRCNNRGFYDHLQRVPYCRGHWAPSVASSNIAGIEGFKPFYDFTDEDDNPVPRHTTIALKVKVREPTYRTLTLELVRTGAKFTTEVAAEYHFIKGKVTTEFSIEAAKTHSITRIKTRERVENEAETSGHSVSVEFEEKADSSASGSVSFNSAASSGHKEVTYTGQP